MRGATRRPSCRPPRATGCSRRPPCRSAASCCQASVRSACSRCRCTAGMASSRRPSARMTTRSTMARPMARPTSRWACPMRAVWSVRRTCALMDSRSSCCRAWPAHPHWAVGCMHRSPASRAAEAPWRPAAWNWNCSSMAAAPCRWCRWAMTTRSPCAPAGRTRRLPVRSCRTSGVWMRRASMHAGPCPRWHRTHSSDCARAMTWTRRRCRFLWSTRSMPIPRPIALPSTACCSWC
ncbi:hypothetical protein D3C72_880770 [compost metagenome]